jgi:hypothetical protein
MLKTANNLQFFLQILILTQFAPMLIDLLSICSEGSFFAYVYSTNVGKSYPKETLISLANSEKRKLQYRPRTYGTPCRQETIRFVDSCWRQAWHLSTFCYESSDILVNRMEPYWNGLEWRKSVLAWPEWLRLEEISFGPTGMPCNGVSRFCHDWNGMECQQSTGLEWSVLACLEWLGLAEVGTGLDGML